MLVLFKVGVSQHVAKTYLIDILKILGFFCYNDEIIKIYHAMFIYGLKQLFIWDFYNGFTVRCSISIYYAAWTKKIIFYIQIIMPSLFNVFVFLRLKQRFSNKRQDSMAIFLDIYGIKFLMKIIIKTGIVTSVPTTL